MTEKAFSDLVVWCHENPRTAADRIRKLEERLDEVDLINSKMKKHGTDDWVGDLAKALQKKF